MSSLSNSKDVRVHIPVTTEAHQADLQVPGPKLSRNSGNTPGSRITIQEDSELEPSGAGSGTGRGTTKGRAAHDNKSHEDVSLY